MKLLHRLNTIFQKRRSVQHVVNKTNSPNKAIYFDDPVSSHIAEIIATELQPSIMSHGGDIEFVSYNNGLVILKFHGNCVGCGAMELTVKYGIERTLKSKFSEIHTIQIIQ